MKNKKNIIITIILAILTIIICGLFYWINHSSILVNKYNVIDNYLCLDDYALRDSDGKLLQDSHSISYEDEYTYYPYSQYSEANNRIYQTSKGISIYSSWEDFVNAYGDNKAFTISCKPTNDYTTEDDEDSGYIFADEITINDFIKDYIDTGKVNFTDYTITIRFHCSTKGNNIKNGDNWFDDNFNFFINFKEVSYTLIFTFNPGSDDYSNALTDHFYLDSITSYRFVY